MFSEYISYLCIIVEIKPISMTEYEKNIRAVLAGIVHPETGQDIVSSGMVEHIAVQADGAVVTLAFRKRRDPFANSIKRQVTAAVAQAFPELAGKVVVTEREEAPAAPAKEKVSSTAGIRHTVAIASGKGGVGKSTVTANLAVTLRDMGYSVGILDADIYGPSMPKMFGVEDYTPQALVRDGQEYILPAEAGGIKIASIGFFISPDDALIWRGPMATTALKQLLHQTFWEGLDYLLIDLPPGTGDVHLSVVGEIKVDGAVVVSTPQQVAVADVRRGVNMFRAEGIDVPVLGIVENMAWFTPAELPENRYYLFGQGGARNMARTEGIDFLGDIPVIQSVMEGGDNGTPAVSTQSEVKKYYREIAEKIVEKLEKPGC